MITIRWGELLSPICCLLGHRTRWVVTAYLSFERDPCWCDDFDFCEWQQRLLGGDQQTVEVSAS